MSWFGDFQLPTPEWTYSSNADVIVTIWSIAPGSAGSLVQCHWKLCVGWTMTTWRLSEVCVRWMLWEVHSGGHLLISWKPTCSHVGLSRGIGGLGFVLKARRVQLAHDFPWEVSACWEEVWDTFRGWMPRNTARTTPEAGLMMSTLILFSLSLITSGQLRKVPRRRGSAGPTCSTTNLWSEHLAGWEWVTRDSCCQASNHQTRFPSAESSIRTKGTEPLSSGKRLLT